MIGTTTTSPYEGAVIRAAPAKKCEVTKVVPQAVIELLRVAPQNEVARAQVLASVLQPLPSEAQTFEQIVDWIEANIDPAVIKPPAPAYPPAYPTHELLQGRTGPTAAYPVRISVNCSDTEVGRCDYRVSRSGSATVEVCADDVLRMARLSDNMDELLDELDTHIREDVEADWPDMDWDEDFSTDNCDSSDTENRQQHHSRNALLSQVSAWLRQHHPDLYNTLTSTTAPFDNDEDDEEGEGM